LDNFQENNTNKPKPNKYSLKIETPNSRPSRFTRPIPGVTDKFSRNEADRPVAGQSTVRHDPVEPSGSKFDDLSMFDMDKKAPQQNKYGLKTDGDRSSSYSSYSASTEPKSSYSSYSTSSEPKNTYGESSGSGLGIKKPVNRNKEKESLVSSAMKSVAMMDIPDLPKSTPPGESPDDPSNDPANTPGNDPAKEPPRRDRAREFRDMMKTAEKKRRKNRILNILLIVFAAIFLVSGFFLFRYFYASHQNKKLNESLKDMIDTEEYPEDEDTEDSTSTEDASEESGEGGSKKHSLAKFVTVDGKLVLRKFHTLYETNKDFIGWITIDDTNIDYPVLYTPYDEQKYLRMNFDGDYALAGTLFLSADSDPVKPTVNMIIYGHNMKDGSMFGNLMDYKDQDFYEQHKRIRFDTIYGTNEYEIIAAFPGQILGENEEGFRYYTFHEPENEEEFNTFIREVTGLSTITPSASAVWGDQLITLSTCDNTGAKEGKRFVVVAKRIGD